MYLLHKIRAQRQQRRWLERQRGAGEQALPGSWQAVLNLQEATPRPHARPVKQVVRHTRTHS